MESISIIIPCLNEEKEIIKTLTCCLKQRVTAKEIIVVDGGSTDTTLSLLSQQKHITLLHSNAHLATQRNMGADHASSSWLIFLDADTHISDSFIEDILTYIASHQVDAFCPIYKPRTNNLLIRAIYTFFNGLFFWFQRLSPSGAGSCIVVKKEIFINAGKFNPTFRSFDDIAFIRTVGRRYSFSQAPIKVLVSDRRFRERGILKTTVQYLLLSLFFVFGLFALADTIPYTFQHKS